MCENPTTPKRTWGKLTIKEEELLDELIEKTKQNRVVWIDEQPFGFRTDLIDYAMEIFLKDIPMLRIYKKHYDFPSLLILSGNKVDELFNLIKFKHTKKEEELDTDYQPFRTRGAIKLVSSVLETLQDF